MDGDLPERFAHLLGDGQLQRLFDEAEGIRLQVVHRAESVQHGDVQVATGLAAERLRREADKGRGQLPAAVDYNVQRATGGEGVPPGSARAFRRDCHGQ